jgi:hypothetical protein
MGATTWLLFLEKKPRAPSAEPPESMAFSATRSHRPSWALAMVV